jgi:adenosine/AMP kinase
VKGLVEKKKIKEAKGLIRTMKKKFPLNLLNAWKKVEENLGLHSTEEDKEVKEATA